MHKVAHSKKVWLGIDHVKATLLTAIVLSVHTGASAVAQAPLQDPTRPVAYTKAESQKQGELRLQAIFLRESGHQAVINGHLVGVGDVIQNLRVRAINKNKVRLVDGDDMRELELRPTILSMPELED